MAWRDRLNNVVRRVADFFTGGGGPSRPRPEPRPFEREPTPIEQRPSAEPFGFPQEPAGFPAYEEYAPPQEPTIFSGWEPEITLYDIYGNEVGSHTKEEWFSEVTNKDKETLLAEYGLDNLDIIYALDDAGEWDDYDWETWRELYDQVHG